MMWSCVKSSEISDLSKVSDVSTWGIVFWSGTKKNKSHHVTVLYCSLKILFLSHLHLPAVKPFFFLSPADVVWISSLESYSWDRPPPQPPSLTLYVYTQMHTKNLLHAYTQIVLYYESGFWFFIFFFFFFLNAKKDQKLGGIFSPLWASHSFCHLVHLQEKKFQEMAHLILQEH